MTHPQELPIDLVLQYDQDKLDEFAQFIAKQLGITYHCDCSIDVFMCSLTESEVRDILKRMKESKS